MYSHRSGLPDHAGDLLEDLGYDRRYVLERLRASAARPVPNLLRLHQLRPDRGCRGGRRRRRASRGRTSPRTCSTGRSAWRRRVRGSPTTWPGRTARSATSTSTATTNRSTCATRNPQSPAGGVSSSVNDMTHWLTMMLANGSYDGKQIVDAEGAAARASPRRSCRARRASPRCVSGFYGFGFNVGTTSAARTQLSHSGAFELGAGTNFVILPSADVAIVALTNATPVGRAGDAHRASSPTWCSSARSARTGTTLYNKAFVQMEQPVGSLVGKQPPANPAPAAPLRVATSAPTTTTTGVRRGSPRRTASCSSRWARNWTSPLTHWDGNVFTFSFVTRERAAGNDLEGDVRRQQADPGVLRRGQAWERFTSDDR